MAATANESTQPLLRAALRRVASSVVCILFLTSSASAQFADRTAEAGLTKRSPSWGAVFVDLDGDGDLDLYAGRHGTPPILYENDGSGRFDAFGFPSPWIGPLDRHGVVFLSLDEDDDPEIFVTHGAGGGAASEANELYRNDGSSGFAPVAASAGLEDADSRSRAVSAADFDGDHFVDLWVGKAPRAGSPNSLFRNEGSMTFSDVALAVGLAETEGTVGGLWGDVDDDGDPDLLVGGEEFSRPTVLYRNDAGSFVDVSAAFVPGLPVISGADLGDFDNDGDLDLAVCDGSLGVFDVFTEGDSVTFYFNTRYSDSGLDGLTIPSTADTLFARLRLQAYDDYDLVFLGADEVNPSPPLPIVLTDEHVGAPVFTPGVDRGIWIWRTSPGGPWELRCSTPFVNADTFDGWFTDGSSIQGVSPHDLEDPGFVPGGPRVWRNDGSEFTEITSALGLPTMLNPRDVSWVDYDNDGDLDLHVVDMGTSASLNAPDALFRNDGSTFPDVTVLEGAAGGTEGLGDGGVWGDVDRDGDLDLYLRQGAGPLSFSEFGPALFLENTGERGNAIGLELVGRASGPAATGTRVIAYAAGGVVPRRVAANSWRGFADPVAVHLGLGSAAVADSITVEWPAGTIDKYLAVAPGFYRLTEGREIAGLLVLTASPDSLAPTQTGSFRFEATDSTGARIRGEAPNFAVASLAGLLTPAPAAVENADSSYTFSYTSGTATGVDTLVVTDPLSIPPLSDSLVVRVTVYPDTIRASTAGRPRVHWSDTLAVRVSILDPNGNRLLDEGLPFSAAGLTGFGTLTAATLQPDSSYIVGFVAESGTGVVADTIVVADPETAAVGEDSLAIEITDTAIIDTITDVENDQGGQVRITWQSDLRDTTGALTPITHYTTWRRSAGITRDTWEIVGPTVPASRQPTYVSIVPTTSDSTAFGSIPWAVFYVSAQTADPQVFFDSAPDSGYSVDNLVPGPPGLVTFVTPDRIEWEAPVDTNYVFFRIWESEVSEFDPTTASMVGVAYTTGFEPVEAPFAFVTAVDGAGNESAASGTANPTALPAILAPSDLDFLAPGRPNPFRSSSRIDFGIREAGIVRLVVYNVLGRRVRTLRDGPAPAGRSFEIWNGLDSVGKRAVPGVYFVRLESPAFRSTRKLVLSR